MTGSWRNLDIFDTLADDALDELASSLTAIRFRSNDLIIRQGELGHHMYLLEKGSVRVTREEHGERAFETTLRAPDVFGEMALVTNEPRSATVSAIEPSLCLRLERDVFKQLVASNPMVAVFLTEGVSRRISSMNRIIAGYPLQTLRERAPAGIKAWRRLNIFRTMTDEVLDDLEGSLTSISFDPNHVILHQGDPGDHMYLLEEGTVLVTHKDPGRRTFRAFLRAPAVFGEMALVTDAPRSASVTAIEPTRCLRLEREDFARLVAAHPMISIFLNEIVGRRLSANQRSESTVSIHHDTFQDYCELLLDENLFVWQTATSSAFLRSVLTNDLDVDRLKHWLRNDITFAEKFLRFAFTMIAEAPLDDFEFLILKPHTGLSFLKGQALEMGVSLDGPIHQTCESFCEYLSNLSRETYELKLLAIWCIDCIYYQAWSRFRPEEVNSRYRPFVERWGGEKSRLHVSKLQSLVNRALDNAGRDVLGRASKIVNRLLRYEIAFWEMRNP